MHVQGSALRAYLPFVAQHNVGIAQAAGELVAHDYPPDKATPALTLRHATT